MKRLAVILSLLFLLNLGLMACDDQKPKKPASRSESDWSAKSMVDDIEAMKKQGKDTPKEAPKEAKESKQGGK